MFHGSGCPQKQHSGAALRFLELLQCRFMFPEPDVSMH